MPAHAALLNAPMPTSGTGNSALGGAAIAAITTTITTRTTCPVRPVVFA